MTNHVLILGAEVVVNVYAHACGMYVNKVVYICYADSLDFITAVAKIYLGFTYASLCCDIYFETLCYLARDSLASVKNRYKKVASVRSGPTNYSLHY